MVFYAHSKESEPECKWQTLKDHLERTAEMAACFANYFNSGELAYIAGIMHDLGKYSIEFQSKLKGKKLFVDHSTAGAQLALEQYGQAIGLMLAYCIAGHHTGIPNYGTINKSGTLAARLRAEVRNYDNYSDEIILPEYSKKMPLKYSRKEFQYFTIAFYIRMLYSCLVDADYLDTERFMKDENVNRSIGEDISVLHEKLMSHLKQFESREGFINEKRREILERCLRIASCERGFYSLKVPTGGGKTLSSMAFALKHAITNGMKRIIYVIPYTSIIEQNAKVFRDILGQENVLEHHSSYNLKEIENDEDNLYKQLKYAEENWDIPVVVTTSVQFYESLFSNKSSKCRKLHNIANSIIILDEAQVLPTQYLRPCLAALSELVENYSCTVLFCTATQPAFEEIIKDMKIREIIESPRELFEALKRVEMVRIGEIDDLELSEQLLKLRQVLCIVNTRKHAKELYKKVSADDGAYHLSTLMCPAHRREVLDEIKDRLSNNDVCRVISTQLIEAGVDIDFPAVYRSSAGLDSIVQSAGRCNREGNLIKGHIYIFYSTERHARALGWLSKTQSAGEAAMRKYNDPLAPDAIHYYFRQLYDIERGTRFDNRRVLECFNNSGAELKFEFEEACHRFKLIDDNTYPVVIPYNEEAKKLISEAKYSSGSVSIMRRLQQYTVSIYENEYNALLGVGVLEDVNGLFMALKDKDPWYDSKEGLIIPEEGEALFA